MVRLPKMAWIVAGLVALGLVLWAVGVPGSTLLTLGLFGGMMLMHGGHGGHGGHQRPTDDGGDQMASKPTSAPRGHHH